jgi:Family of unknown function (DUF6114)
VTSVDQPQAPASVPARAWRAFRTWQHGRPFWGGLVTIVAGIEYYLSVHLNPLSFSVSFGQNGFVAWLLPLGLTLCGALAWVSPAQRLFYGILAAAASVYGLIGLNLGGFFLGMLIGIVGGSLIASWTPRQAQPAAGDTAPAGDDGSTDGEPDETFHDGGLDVVTETAELPSGPLSDELPSASAQAELARTARHAAPDQSTAPRRRLWRPGGRGATLVVLPVAIAAVALVAGGHGTPAFAAPTACPTVKPPATGSKPTTPAAPTPTIPAPTTPAAASPAPSPSTDANGNPVGDLINGIVSGIGSLLGAGGDSTPTPTPTQSAAPAGTPAQAAAPTAAKPATAKPTRPKPSSCSTPSPSASASATPLNATVLAAPADQPPVASSPATLTTDRLVMSKLVYNGVFDLPKKGGGTVQVLKFSMDSAVQTPFKLAIPDDSTPIVQTSSQLTISGNVEFYCTSFTGMIELLGVTIPVPLTFTPDGLQPPPSPTEPTVFRNVTIKLVYVKADKIVANDFGNVSNASAA